jgi:hypothetical protein
VWIELHQSLPRHPKLFRLAKELKVEPPIAFWHLCNLWLWSLDYAPSGDLTGMTDTEMAAAANWSGDPNNFIRGLCTCGWLDPGPRIHDWELYAGKLFERKEANRLKAQRFRKRNRDVTDTSPLRNGVRNQKVTEIVPSERTVEDSRGPTVQNKQITTPAPTAAPDDGKSHLEESIKETRGNPWSLWCVAFKAKGFNIYPTPQGPDLAAAQTLKKLVPDVDELYYCMEKYLRDDDRFLSANGWGLRYMPKRLDTYRIKYAKEQAKTVDDFGDAIPGETHDQGEFPKDEMDEIVADEEKNLAR